MPKERLISEEESQPLTGQMSSMESYDMEAPRSSSVSSASTTSLVLEELGRVPAMPSEKRYVDGHNDTFPRRTEEFDIETSPYTLVKPVDRKARRLLWIIAGLALTGWLVALFSFIHNGSYKHASTKPHDPLATSSRGSGKKITLDQIMGGAWSAKTQSVSWIAGPNGEDGLLLEKDTKDGYLVVEDIRKGDEGSAGARVLMKYPGFQVGDQLIHPNDVWPSKDFEKVLCATNREKNWRHSFTAKYWIFDVQTQTAEALDPQYPDARVQLAAWSPQSDAVVFTRDNNMFLRKLSEQKVTQITKDGSPDLFYGIPDWVYEEEVFGGNSATWWSEDGQYIAFLQTNESMVPTFPVQYYLSRPSGKEPAPGEEAYPDVVDIKYPKAGAPNPVVKIQFYDVAKNEVFSVNIDDDFKDDDRLITEVIWAGRSKKVLVRETNRESDILKLVLMDVERRSGKTVRTEDINKLDGGWFEVSQDTTFIPSDPGNGRNHDGYIDTIIHEGYNHLGYFTPLDNPEPILLTQGNWEVVDAPSAVDLKNNTVYFVSTKESSIQRHVYRVSLDGNGLEPLTDTGKEGFYDVSFSTGAGYALLTYNGPGIPWQKVVSTPTNPNDYERTLEENKMLEKISREYELPIDIFDTIDVGGFKLNYLERRPPHFDPKKKYPVLFNLYNGPGSQLVQRKFKVDFHSYIASNLGYIVVIVDGRGTGFLGREARAIVRGNLGYYEAHDQISAAKIWAKKNYVDADKIAIWGWSYGGFMTLKTLELDGGETFKYGMAVAPVTDWRFYDSIYTERYMHTPQHNPGGYDNSSITDVKSLSKNVRWLMMHGASDDNVHTQNSLTLLDKLDLAGIENYDVHFFPDSDHNIFFHNANRIVYDKLANWLINAFNGEWLRTENPVPVSGDEVIVRLE